MFGQLFAEIKRGNTTDTALETFYGFDQDGLENKCPQAHNRGGGR